MVLRLIDVNIIIILFFFEFVVAVSTASLVGYSYRDNQKWRTLSVMSKFPSDYCITQRHHHHNIKRRCHISH